VLLICVHIIFVCDSSYQSQYNIKLQDHVQAQIDLIDEVLKWSYGSDDLGNRSPKRVVDVGCGIGGSSRHIVKKYPGSTAQGITLSPYQANRGNEVRFWIYQKGQLLVGKLLTISISYSFVSNNVTQLAKEQGLSDRASFQVSSIALFRNTF
jgi:hypothetical protein